MIIGGDSPSGKLLKDFVLYEASLEDEIPKVSPQQMPSSDADSVSYSSGKASRKSKLIKSKAALIT